MSRICICNPISGSGDHAPQVRELADEHGFTLHETEQEGDTVEFAREFGPDADIVAACGGDGTINEVVTGLYEADCLDTTTLAVIPAGTGNNFASQLGIPNIETAFDLVDAGEVRHIDLALANDRPFVNSCVAGLTAEASAETTPELKSKYGILAYVFTTFRTMNDYEGMRLAIETDNAVTGSWSGKAFVALIGNARRFPANGGTQANVEDGLLDVTIAEERPTMELMGEAAVSRFLGSETAHLHRLKSKSLTISVLDGTTHFSLDGEMLETNHLTIETLPQVLSVFVGEGYEPVPDEA
ncbi:diacylglycerol/lipid kinase family protein [Haladaptatus sp. ZSTT2]|uniref:diacylglycerol/lipid kinase family protein n=1 Tax=Haladaptatus sp. ZSTT2 TaxID=3120515 RepID=UPI00300F5F76